MKYIALVGYDFTFEEDTFRKPLSPVAEWIFHQFEWVVHNKIWWDYDDPWIVSKFENYKSSVPVRSNLHVKCQRVLRGSVAME
jgi:hypothetical protein